MYSIDSIDDSIHVAKARNPGATRRLNNESVISVDFSMDIQVPLADGADGSDANNRKRWVLQRQDDELRDGDKVEVKAVDSSINVTTLRRPKDSAIDPKSSRLIAEIPKGAEVSLAGKTSLSTLPGTLKTCNQTCDLTESTHTTSSMYSIDSIDDSIHVAKARNPGATRRLNNESVISVDFSMDIQVPLADGSDAYNRKRWVLRRQDDELRDRNEVENFDLPHDIVEAVNNSINVANIMNLPYCFDSTHDSMHMTKTRLPTLRESSEFFNNSGGSSRGSPTEKQGELYPASSDTYGSNISDEASVTFSDDESFADPDEFETKEDYGAALKDPSTNTLNSGLMLMDKNNTLKTISTAELSPLTKSQLDTLTNSKSFKLSRSGRAERDLFKSLQRNDDKERSANTKE